MTNWYLVHLVSLRCQWPRLGVCIDTRLYRFVSLGIPHLLFSLIAFNMFRMIQYTILLCQTPYFLRLIEQNIMRS